jgi:hypothetical protein
MLGLATAKQKKLIRQKSPKNSNIKEWAPNAKQKN